MLLRCDETIAVSHAQYLNVHDQLARDSYASVHGQPRGARVCAWLSETRGNLAKVGGC